MGAKVCLPGLSQEELDLRLTETAVPFVREKDTLMGLPALVPVRDWTALLSAVVRHCTPDQIRDITGDYLKVRA